MSVSFTLYPSPKNNHLDIVNLSCPSPPRYRGSIMGSLHFPVYQWGRARFSVFLHYISLWNALSKIQVLSILQGTKSHTHEHVCQKMEKRQVSPLTVCPNRLKMEIQFITSDFSLWLKLKKKVLLIPEYYQQMKASHENLGEIRRQKLP